MAALRVVSGGRAACNNAHRQLDTSLDLSSLRVHNSSFWPRCVFALLSFSVFHSRCTGTAATLLCQGTCLDLDTGLVLVMNLNFVNSGSQQPFVHLEASNSLINIVVRSLHSNTRFVLLVSV